jgi:hypothetical protein
MPSTYTVNLGIEKPATGEQSGTWGDTTNVNFDIIDQAVNGSERVTLTSAGTSGSPNDLNIVNGSTTSSEGRNKWIEIYSASDLGGSAYVRLVPNDAEKILFIRNSLAGSQSVLLFQGTYNASNDLEIPAGVDMVVRFDGAGASATVTDVFTKLRATEITTPTLTAGTADINGGSVDGATVGAASASTGAFTTLTASTSLNIASSTTVDGVLDEDNMASNSATKLATQQSIKAYVDSQVGTVDTLAEILANGNTSGANNLIIDSGQALTSNTINETTAASGVTIDSVLLKDDGVNATNLEITNLKANDGTSAGSIADSTGVVTLASSVLTTADINGGTIDGTTLGATTPASVAATTLSTTGDISLPDGAKAIFGAGSDLQIYHTGTDSRLVDSGTGTFYIAGTDIVFLDGTLAERYADFTFGGAAQLYYDNSAKLATTATGIDVTGTVTADNAEIGTLGASDANAIIDLTGDTTYTDFGFRIIRNSGANGRTDLRHRGTGDFVIEAVEAAEIAFETSDTERFRIASDGSLSTPTLGTSNVRFGVNAGNSITSGGDYNVVVGDEAGTALTTGDENTFIGYTAGDATTTASGNTALGFSALTTNVLGSRSVAIGRAALQVQNPAIATNMYNVAVGHGAGESVTTGVQNTLIGGLAGDAQTTASNNTAVGYASLGANTTGPSNTAIGHSAMAANTTGNTNTAVGNNALAANTVGDNNTALGNDALGSFNPSSNSDTFNTAVGSQAGAAVTTGIQNTLIGGLAGDAQTTASNNTAVGYQALTATTTGGDNDAFGSEALRSLTTANLNVALGRNAMYSTTTGASNLAAGTNAMYSNTEGGSNVALGKDALRSNTTASNNTAVGYQAGYANSTSERITFVGYQAGYSSSPGSNDNTGVGSSALLFTSSGANNTAVGSGALLSNTTASGNTAVGYQAGYSNTTGGGNTFIGNSAGLAVTTGVNNLLVGNAAGLALTTGLSNTFVGAYSNSGSGACGGAMTTGSKNTIIGGYSGNQGGLDIRTASNHIVLSDGDGNPRGVFDASGNLIVGGGVLNTVNAFSVHPATNPYIGLNKSLTGTHDAFYFQHNGSVIGKITYSDSATAYVTSSDYRLKENVTDITDGIDRLKQLPVHKFNFIVDPDTTVDGFLAHEVQDIVPEAITGTKDEVDAEGKPVYQGIDQSKLVPLLTAALKEAITRIETLEAEVAAIKGA